MIRSGLFTHEGRQKQRVCEKAKPALAALFCGRGGERLISQFLRREDGGATNPARGGAHRLVLTPVLP
jgi:hypothetical protein